MQAAGEQLLWAGPTRPTISAQAPSSKCKSQECTPNRCSQFTHYTAHAFGMLGCYLRGVHTYTTCQVETMSSKHISSGAQKALHTLSHSAPPLLLRRWKAGINTIKQQFSRTLTHALSTRHDPDSKQRPANRQTNVRRMEFTKPNARKGTTK